jgi:hypothetical protein
MLTRFIFIFSLSLLLSCSDGKPQLPCQSFIDEMSLSDPLVREHLVSWSNVAIHDSLLWKALVRSYGYDLTMNDIAYPAPLDEIGIDWQLIGISITQARLELVGNRKEIDYRDFNPTDVSEVRIGYGSRGYAVVRIMPATPLHQERRKREVGMISHSFTNDFSVQCWGPRPGD